MKSSVIIATLAAVVSAQLSSTHRDEPSAVGTSILSELTTAPTSDIPTTFSTLPRLKKSESTTARLTADPWPTTFQQFESSTKRPKTHRPKKTRCTEPPAQFPTTFQQFPSVYRAKTCHPTKGRHIPDPNSAHPTHVTRPAPSVLDPWKAHQPHIVITQTTAVGSYETTAP